MSLSMPVSLSISVSVSMSVTLSLSLSMSVSLFLYYPAAVVWGRVSSLTTTAQRRAPVSGPSSGNSSNILRNLVPGLWHCWRLPGPAHPPRCWSLCCVKWQCLPARTDTGAWILWRWRSGSIGPGPNRRWGSRTRGSQARWPDRICWEFAQ
jgi:hypothetical protein